MGTGTPSASRRMQRHNQVLLDDLIAACDFDGDGTVGAPVWFSFHMAREDTFLRVCETGDDGWQWQLVRTR